MLVPRLLSRFKSNPFAVKGVQWRRNCTELQARLPSIIGHKRYERLLTRKYVKVHKETPKYLDALVLGMADVRFEDLAELFAELKNNTNETVRHLDVADTAKMKTLIEPHDIYKPLPKAVIDALMYVLVPVETIEDIFLNEDKPVVTNGSHVAQENLSAISVLMLYSHYLRLAENVTVPEYWFILGKRIIDREPRVGTILPHPNGYYVVIKNISADNAQSVTDILRGGAYIVACEPMSTIGEDFRPLLFCRGTRVSLEAVSVQRTWADNLRACQGADGIILDFDRVRGLLNIPAWQGQSLWIGGMSLGGGHAQRLCLALLSIGVPVAELFVVSGIGLEMLSLRWFKHLEMKPQKIHYFIDIEDPTFLLGDGHLGYDCPNQDIDLWCISPSDHNEEPDTFLKVFSEIHAYSERSYIENIKRLFLGLANDHATYRLWYEMAEKPHVLYFNKTNYPEILDYLMDNTIGDKKWLEASRRYHLWAKYPNKFIDFLGELLGHPPQEWFTKWGDRKSISEYVANQQQYALTTLFSWRSQSQLLLTAKDTEEDESKEEKVGTKP